MIHNIIDSRERQYRWKKVNAIVESTFHDNSVRDSDRIEPSDYNLYAECDGITLKEAIAWANSYECPVTLFLYDGHTVGDDGTSE